MRSNDNLATSLVGNILQNHKHLLLSQNLKMCIRLVNHEDPSFVRIEVRQNQQHLLHPAPGKNEFQIFAHIELPICQRKRTARLIVSRLTQTIAEHTLHDFANTLPIVLGSLPNLVAKIAQDLCCLTLSQQNVDPTIRQPCLFGCLGNTRRKS